MDRGTYAAASGGLAQFRKLEVVNNNLANINTPGYKKLMITGQEQTFAQTLASQIAQNDPYAEGDQDRTPGVTSIKVATDFSAGPILNTGNPLDVALRNPKDFFVVNTPDGTRYTRSGNFTLNSEGTLVTQDGFEVQGDGGAITANGVGVTITPSGNIKSSGAIVGKLQVARFEDTTALQHDGGSRFSLNAGTSAPQDVDPEVISNSIEMSNVSAITSVIDLISAQRAFQMYAKTSETIDTMNQTAINSVGRRNG